MRNPVTLWFENANWQCQRMCVHVRVCAKQKNLMLIKVNAVWLSLIQFSMLIASHTYAGSRTANRWDIGEYCRLHNISQSNRHIVCTRDLNTHYNFIKYIVLDFILASIRFGCSACAVTHLVVFVTHAHNALWYLCNCFQPMANDACMLIIATYIRIIGYSVLAWVSVA